MNPAGTRFFHGRFTEDDVGENVEEVEAVEITSPPTIIEGDPSLDTHPTAAD